MTRVVSIGLDGAAWHKLDRLVADGQLPNLAELTNTGARAPLRSVTPPVTCPAWRCSTSGKNPGKLGVYWWLNIDRDSGEIVAPNATSFSTADIWDYLGDDGYRCAVLNVPMTYPPSEINGTMVSGFGAAFDLDEEHEQSITYPPTFEDDLVEKYDWETQVDDVTTEEGLETAYKMIHSRCELLSDILAEDYEYVHLTVFAINALQHKYGDSEETTRAWKLIDDYLGQINTDDTLLMIYSDHGNSDIDHTFVINRWLLDNDYLSLSSDTASESSLETKLSERAYTALESRGISPKKAAVYARRVLPSSVYDAMLPSSFPISSAELVSEIDWTQTDALAFSQGPLYLNRERLGDRYESIREELREQLTNLTFQGSQVLTDVQPAEEVYTGPFVADAPDLLLSSSERWEIYGGITPSAFESQAMSWTSGNHPLGILLLNGPGVDSRELSECSILDIAPTVLSYLDSPIPTDMDGAPLEAAFSDSVLSVSERDPIDTQSTKGEDMEDGFRDQLQELGYLD